MEKTLEKILEAIQGLQIGQENIKASIYELKIDVKEIRRKTNVIFDQTAGLTEFTTTATDSLTRLATVMI